MADDKQYAGGGKLIKSDPLAAAKRVQANGLLEAPTAPQRVQAPPLVSEDAFSAAGTPGRGSAVGDFVPGKNGGWVPSNHPDAAGAGGGGAAPPTRVQGDPLAGLPAGSAGANAGEAGPAGAAMAGLSAASAGGGGGGVGVQQLPPQGAGNPNLGQRIYPVAMRQLAALPRIY